MFIYECKNCGGEFISRKKISLLAVFCPACHCDMYLVAEPDFFDGEKNENKDKRGNKKNMKD